MTLPLPGLDPGYLDTTPTRELSVDQRRTLHNRRLLEAGRHPATRLPVLDRGWGFECGDCVHAQKVSGGARSYWKCARHRLGMSASAASDIRTSWPACSLLVIDPEQPVEVRRG